MKIEVNKNTEMKNVRAYLFEFDNGSVIKTIHGKPVRGNRVKIVPYDDAFIQADLLGEILREDEQEEET
jgi:hypothetical protein